MRADEDEAPGDEEEDDTYEPYPVEVSEGSCLIFDPVEFAEMTNSVAVIVRDGGLFVLDRETRHWRNVEAPADKPRAGVLGRIK